jgi:hypothetical protein
MQRARKAAATLLPGRRTPAAARIGKISHIEFSSLGPAPATVGYGPVFFGQAAVPEFLGTVHANKFT